MSSSSVKASVEKQALSTKAAAAKPPVTWKGLKKTKAASGAPLPNNDAGSADSKAEKLVTPQDEADVAKLREAEPSEPSETAEEKPSAESDPTANDAEGEHPDAAASKILSKVIRTAEGRSRDDKYWTTREWTFQEFADRYLVDFERGPKDARCTTQGGLVGQRRLARAVDANYVGMYDHDTGETVGEIAEKIQVVKNPVTGKGYFAVLWTTHSHLKNTTDISQSALAKYSKKTGIDLDEENFIELARGYLKTEKNVKDAVLASITDVDETMTETGVVYRVTHDPMHRVRSLFLLEDPYDFTKGGLQQDRITEWKERYAGFATSLGLTTDPSCVDPSRLMYTPRIAVGADRSVHEIRVVNPDGNLLRWQDMPRQGKERKGHARAAQDNPFAAAAQELTGRAASALEAEAFQTPGLKKFMALAKGCFEIERFLEEQGADFRGSIGHKHHFECPNDDAHTDAGNPDDKGFFVVNASENEDGPGNGSFGAYCAHATCLSEFGSDRARYLDAACVKYGIAHAKELLEWCSEPLAWDDEDDEPTPDEAVTQAKLNTDTQLAFEQALVGLTSDATTEQIHAVLKIVADGGNGLYEETRMDQICGVLVRRGNRRKILEKTVRDLRKAAQRGAAVNAEPSKSVVRAVRGYNDLGHAVIKTGGGVAVLWPPTDRDAPLFMSAADFKLFYAEESVWVDDKQVPVADLWLKSPERKKYWGVVNAPFGVGQSDNTSGDYYNLFGGWPVRPKGGGSWSKFREHIRENLCQSDDRHFEWLISWLAQMFREPARKPGSVIVLRGGKGTGKSIFGKIIKRFFAHWNSLTLSKKEQLVGRFNAHLASAVFVVVEEALFAGDKAVDGVLKEVITGDTQIIEPKNVNLFEVANHVHMVMITNEDWAVPASGDDRRYFLLDVGNARKGQSDYFEAMLAELDNGGLEAMLADLMAWRQPGWVDLRNPPRTAALGEQVQYGWASHEKWIAGVLERGVIETASQKYSLTNVEPDKDEQAFAEAGVELNATQAPRPLQRLPDEGLEKDEVVAAYDEYARLKKFTELYGVGFDSELVTAKNGAGE